MAIKLGSSDVSFRLGAAEVDKVYLGAVEVYSAEPPEPRTLYFDGDVDDAWTTLGNWWFDAAPHTVPATSLPTAVDSVVVTGGNITASGQTVVDFTLLGNGALQGTLTVTGMATFNDLSGNVGTVTGNATFNDNSVNVGTVTGNATFNDSSVNLGTVTGTCTGNC